APCRSRRRAARAPLPARPPWSRARPPRTAPGPPRRHPATSRAAPPRRPSPSRSARRGRRRRPCRSRRPRRPRGAAAPPCGGERGSSWNQHRPARRAVPSAAPALGLPTTAAGAEAVVGGPAMCRSIKPLFNFDPPATDEEVRAAALQYVRKVSGFQKPSRANEAAFAAAVEEVAAATRRLVDALETNAPPKDREVEAA